MHFHKVIVHEVQRNGVHVVFNFLAETVGQAGKAAHVHPHGQVLTLNMRRADKSLVGVAFNRALFGASAFSGRVFLFVALLARGVAIQLDQLGVIHVATERAFDCFQISLVTVSGQLNSVRQTRSQIVHKADGVFAVTPADHVGHDQLAVAVQRGPRPSVASVIGRGLGGLHVLLLSIGERPDFIALDNRGFNVPHVLIVILGASLTCVDQQLNDGVLGHVGDARRSANAVTFDQKADDQGAGFGIEFSHKFNVSDQYSLVKHIGQFNINVKAVLTAIEQCDKTAPTKRAGVTMTSPGDFIREKMEAKQWTQSDLAYALGTKPAAINQILNNKRAISLNMAKSLAAALGCDAKAIAETQTKWDLDRTDDPDPSVTARAKILSRYPLREMVKRGWVDPEHGVGTLEEQVCRFFEVSSIADVPHLSHSAKRTKYEEIPPEQLAWLFRVKSIADEMTSPAFNRQKLQDAIEEFSSLRSKPDGVRHVPRLLEAAGVRFVIVEGIAKSAIDGVCFWLDDNKPVIGLSLRYDRIDNFWFVLRHECAHVLHGHGKSSAILDCDLGESDLAQSVSEEEKIANQEAADFCVPEKKMTSFYLRKKPYFSERDVVAFSVRMDVHPGLVVGQLQRRMGRYDFLRKHLVKVRETLANAMMMDGWGDLVPTER